MPVLLAHKNGTDITGLIKDGVSRTIDIAAFLKHPDTTKIVVIEMTIEDVQGSVRGWACNAVGEINLGGQSSWNGTIPHRGAQVAIQLIAGTTTIAYSLFAGYYLKVVSEFGGPNVKTFPVRTRLADTANFWATKDLTAQVGADAGSIEGVICRIWTTSAFGLGFVCGLRASTSADLKTTMACPTTSMWGTAKVSAADQFHYLNSLDTNKNPGPNVFFEMAGYWLTGSDLVATENRDPAEAITKDGAFHDFTINELAQTETQAIVQLFGSAQSLGQTARSKGATQEKLGGDSTIRTVYAANLDAVEALEYATDDAATEFRIEATQHGFPVNDTASLLLGRRKILDGVRL